MANKEVHLDAVNRARDLKRWALINTMIKIWDIFLGIVLISGAPLIVLFLPGVLPFPFDSDLLANLLIGADVILAIWVWASAIKYRYRHRLTSRWLLGVEIVIAAVIGLAYFSVMGMAVHTAYCD